MRVYLDNCVFNRLFDDSSQLRIREEAEAVLEIRRRLEMGQFELVWSYVIDAENARNPFAIRQQGVESWKSLSIIVVEPAVKIVSAAIQLRLLGLKDIDSLHVACAIEANSSYFVTTDDAILNISPVGQLSIVDPTDFLREVERYEKRN